MSKNEYKNHVGIDVSKRYLDVCVRSTGEYFRTENNAEGFKMIQERLSGYSPCLLIAEATGGYEADMVRTLQKCSGQVKIDTFLKRFSFNFSNCIGLI